MNAILFDIDGVLYQGEAPIPGAPETLDWVRSEGIPHLYLTNTSSRPRSALVAKLARMGIEVNENELLTPPVAAAGWLRTAGIGSVALFVPDATRTEFSGFEVVDEAGEREVGAVVVGDLGTQWDFHRLNHAFRLLMSKPQPQLVALGMTRYWCAEDGLRLDAGAFVTALAYAAGVEPLVLGKPAKEFFKQALAALGTSAGQTVMIGDDLVSDVGAAQAVGICGVLVRTGKFRPSDLAASIIPNAVLDSVGDLPKWWSRP